MSKKIYKFVETRDLVFITKYNVGKFTNEFLELDRHTIKIFGSHLKGYAWDGCSPKFEFLDVYLGAPDGVVRKQAVEEIKPESSSGHWVNINYLPKTYYASLLHDILYQYKADIPVSRKTTDLIFLEILERGKFKPAKLYFYLVRLFGGLFGKWKTK